MFTNELKHGNVKKIVVDPTSGDVHLITPIFPIGKITNHKELVKKWGVTEIARKVYENCCRAIGKADLTLMKTLDDHFAHPTKEGASQFENYTFQSQYSLGKLAHVFPNPDSDKVMWGAYKITDPIAKPVVLEYMDSYNKGLVPLFTSSQIVNSASENPYAIERFDLMHTTLTDDPSFGTELTKVGAVCQGNTQQCTMQIRTASNTSENVNVMIIGKDVNIRHKTCPFCIETELRNLFSKNSSLKLNKASNLQMSAQQTDEKPNEEKIINPDADQNNNSSKIDPIELSKLVDEKIKEAFNKQEVKSQEQEKPEEQKPESPQENKEEKIKIETSKEISFKDTPEYKQMQAKIEKLAQVAEKNKVDSEELKTLKAEQNFNKIGTLLAKYESNFVNPETNKADAKSFDKAFEFLRNTGWELTDIETTLQILSPYGNTSKKYTEPQKQSVIQSAARNRGIPQYNSAFGDKEEVINDASEKKSFSGLRLVDSILQENNI